MSARPQLVIVEYNGEMPFHESKVVPYDPNFGWDGTQWMGASFSALVKVGAAKGYIPVYANGVNVFFLQKKLVANAADFDPEKIYRFLPYHPADPYNRPFTQI